MVTTTVRARTTGMRKVYIGVGLLSILLAFVGFWPTYFGPVLFEAATRPTILHVHAAVFVGWLVLFIAQACFAAIRRVDVHIRIGRMGIAYGAVLIVVGLTTGYVRSLGYVAAGDLARGSKLLCSILLDMTVFTSFFVAAVVARKKPELHKRLMIVAGTSLLVAAVARMQFLRSMWLTHAVWFSPILLTMLADYRRRRRVHPVLLIGLAALLLQSPIFKPAVASTDFWRSTSGWLLGLAS